MTTNLIWWRYSIDYGIFTEKSCNRVYQEYGTMGEIHAFRGTSHAEGAAGKKDKINDG